MEKFRENVVSNRTMDDDGTGYYASESRMTNLEVDIVDVYKDRHQKEYTHVMWFSK